MPPYGSQRLHRRGDLPDVGGTHADGLATYIGASDLHNRGEPRQEGETDGPRLHQPDGVGTALDRHSVKQSDGGRSDEGDSRIMASRSKLAIKKIRFSNPWKSIGRNFQRDAENLPKREAAFIRRRAKSIMRKAPKKPKTPYGNMKLQKRKTKRHMSAYWQKGAYSRPGHPPYYHGSAKFNLRFITFGPVQQPTIPRHAKSGGDVYAQRVGPVFKPNKWNPTPIPGLHEYGGKVRLSRKGKTYTDNSKRIKMRRRLAGNGVADYPERPYMRPSAIEGRESSARKAPNSYKKLLTLGGLKGKRKR